MLSTYKLSNHTFIYLLYLYDIIYHKGDYSMKIVDHLYIACVASMLVLWLTPGGVVEKIFNALAFYCFCAVVAKMFCVLKGQ